MDTEEKLKELVNYAIHHLSCGYTSNESRIAALRRLQHGLHSVEAAQQSVQQTASGAGGRRQNSLQSSFIADDPSAKHGGGSR